MNEVTKLYELARVEKLCDVDLRDVFASKINVNCKGKCTSPCKYSKYPPFTAEKQIEIVKFLLAKDVFKCYQHYTSKAYIVLTDDVKDFICNKPFDEFLASYINYLWLSLTEKEKQQIKEILEC